jgi:hypothetical protein
MLKSSKFWKTFFLSYVTLVAGIWGFIEAYTYFQGACLKQLLGPYWVLLYTLPLPVAFIVALAKHKLLAETEQYPGEAPVPQPAEPRPASPPSVDISGNWLIGANVIRVLRDSVRVARNLLLGQSRIEVEAEPPQAAKPSKKKAKKRKK